MELGSGEYWLERLEKMHRSELPGLNALASYRVGRHPIPAGHKGAREAFSSLQRQARSNYVGLVVEAVKDRLRPVGFRTGAAGDELSDTASRMSWQANALDAESGVVHDHALTFGRAYVMVGPSDEFSGGFPVITAEDPRHVTHVADPLRRRRVLAALKRYEDDVAGTDHAVVYLPSEIHYFVRKLSGRHSSKGWLRDGPAIPNVLGQVPVVPFINRAALNSRGCSEFGDVLDIQDRINTVILDRLVIGKMQAYRQRWARGLKLEDSGGNQVESFDPGSDLLWAVEDPDVVFGEFGTTDLRPLLDAARSDVNDLAAITRTPPQYLLGALANLSGDALREARMGLTAKVRDRMSEFGESWEAVDRLAAMYTGRDVPEDSEMLWAEPDVHPLAELSDYAVKAASVGVPWPQLMADLGYTPAAIKRMDSERSAITEAEDV